jgi:ornithine cyclodeaminase/alanine dehydrogenase-like protein (mu-crystallin family)
MTLFLNNDDVKSLLTVRMTIDEIEEAYIDLIRGNAVARVHTNLQIPTGKPDETYTWGTTDGGSSSGYLAIRMTSEIRYESEVDGIRRAEKYCVRKGAFCGLVFLFKVSNGEPLAILNDGHLQQQRVGADAAIGIKYMARENAEVLGMFGAGGMARSHIATIREVRNIRKLQVYDPIRPAVETYADEVRRQYGIETVVLDNPDDVFKGADIVAECTNAVKAAVIQGRKVEKGTHIVSTGRRVDKDFFETVDRWLRLGNATPPAGEEEVTDEHLNYVTPSMAKAKKKHGHSAGFDTEISKEKSILLKDLLAGKKGRVAAGDITYSERGNIMGAQFYPISGALYELAKEKGIGREIPTEWFLQDIRN